MARNVSSIAPWAEIVSSAPYPMSIEEFEHWSKEPGWRYELVEGRLVRVGEPGLEHGAIIARLIAVLMAFVLPRGLGTVYGPAAYRLPRPGEVKPTELGPDVTFVARGHGPTPGTAKHKHPGDFALDLVAEVASEESNQYRPEMTAKARRYLNGGVRLVWILYPQWSEIDVWWQGALGPESQTLQADQYLDGRDVLPGFAATVAGFFPASDAAC